MRVAYLHLGSPGQSVAAVRKTAGQLAVWRQNGVDAQLVSLADATHAFSGVPLHVVPMPYRPGPRDAVALHYLARIPASPALRRTLRALSPDVVYMRQTIWWPGMLWALQGFPVVLEVNAKDLEEMRRTWRLRYHIHRLTRDRVFRQCAGVVAVTDEIAAYLSETLELRQVVISNGTRVDPSAMRPPPTNPRPVLVFAGSPRQPWHGVDRLPALAALLPEIEFHVFGPECPSAPNLHVHGFVSLERLREAYAGADVGIGSLAIHRNNMRQACTLKVREYLAAGLPVIAGYEDVDLRGAPYFLDIGPGEDNVERSADRIRAFVAEWRGRSLPPEDVHQRISEQLKEERRLTFLEEAARNHKLAR